MKRETIPDTVLDDLLIRWHHWRAGYKPARGFNGRSLVTGEYRTSRQYDDINGALDDDIERSIMQAVEFQITELSPLHYIAICVQAMALVAGVSVFTNPRLPTDRREREALVQLARQALMQRLLAAGIT